MHPEHSIDSQTFSELPLFIKTTLASQKIQDFTPIQNKVIPALLSERSSIIALSPTGSGKTLAYLIPLLTHLSLNSKSRAIITVPTRDLALQVDKTVKTYCQNTSIRSIVLIGQTSVNIDILNLNKNPQIIVATPGRLTHHLKAKQVEISGVDTLIFDEVDRLLDEGFKTEYECIMEEYPLAQKICFSATMATKLKIILEKSIGKDYLFIDNSSQNHKKDAITQNFVNVEEKSKFSTLLEYIRNSRSTVIFVNTKFFAKTLVSKLNANSKKAFIYTSNLSVNKRKSVLQQFQSTPYSCIVATDVAARGIDFKNLALVVNYHVPYRPSDYIHRIGRTGRSSNTGECLTLVSESQTKFMQNIHKFRQTNEQIITTPKRKPNSNFKPFYKSSSSTKKYFKHTPYTKPSK